MTDNQSLDRLLRILASFAEQPSWGVRELARAIGLHHATAHRQLKALAARGLLIFEPEKQRYIVGSELYRLGFHLTRDFDMSVCARPHTIQLAQQYQETVFVGQFVPERLEVFIFMAEESPHPLRIVPQLFQYFPLYGGALARAILAFLQPEAIRRVIRQSRLRALTEDTITDSAKLQSVLEDVQRKGYAVSHGERISNVSAVAAPIFSANGIVGSLSLTMPTARWDASNEEKLAHSVTGTAKSISQAMGYR